MQNIPGALINTLKITNLITLITTYTDHLHAHWKKRNGLILQKCRFGQGTKERSF